MGCYDYFMGECPSCKAQLHIQTKLGSCLSEGYKPGDIALVSLPEATCTILLKEPCQECNKPVVAHFFDGFLTHYTPGPKARYEEQAWGNIVPQGPGE